MSDNVKVVVRSRPLVARERTAGSQKKLQKIPDEPQIVVNDINRFTFDYVFMEDSDQETVYRASVQPMIERFLQGFNCTVLAYGQTGSGKTYTMGTNYTGGSDESFGIIPRAVEEVFNTIRAQNFQALLQCTFVELYMEDLFDLLHPEKKKIDIYFKDGQVDKKNLMRKVVKSPQEVFNCLQQGSSGRHTGATDMNAQSSRSHAVFMIDLEVETPSGEALKSTFNLVDLAGSERVKKTNASGDRLKEGVQINLGLMHLGSVINALASRNPGTAIATFRSSKLTRILQPSLGGNAVTVMIACISPADSNIDETLSTLRYADRAKQIKNKPIVNRNMANSAEIQRLNEIIAELRQRLVANGQSDDISLELAANVNGEHMVQESELIAAREAIAELTLRLQTTVEHLTNAHYKLHLFESVKEEFEKTFETLTEKIKLLGQMLDNSEPNLTFIKELFVEIETIIKNNQEKLNTQNEDISNSEHNQNDFNQSNTMTAEETQTLMEECTTKQIDFNEKLQCLTKELQMKEDLHKKYLQNIIDSQKTGLGTTIIHDYEQEIDKLEKEKSELQEQLKSSKNNPAQKISEERRQKLKVLESEIDQFKKKLRQQEAVIKSQEKEAEKMQKLSKEIEAMKRDKVRLVREMKQEQENFRKAKLQKEREVNVLKERERKRKNDIIKMERQFESQRNVLRFKAESANKKVKLLQEKLQRNARLKKAGNKDPAQIASSLPQELEIIASVAEIQASLKQFMEERAEIQAKIDKLDSENDAAEIEILESDFEKVNDEVTSLQKKLQVCDIEKKMDVLAKELLTSEQAVHMLLEHVQDTRTESAEEKARLESELANFKVKEEEWEIERKEFDNKMLSVQTEYEVRVGLLIKNVTNKGLLNGDNAEMKPMIDDLLARIEELKEENHQLKLALEPKKKPTNKRLQNLQDDVEMSDISVNYDTDQDPEWSFSEVGYSKKFSQREKKNESGTAEKDLSKDITCKCKTDCSKKQCGCRKNSVYCSTRCRCTGCLNKGPSDGEDEENSPKKIRLDVDNEENKDPNKFGPKYPYKEVRRTFYVDRESK